MLHHMSDDVLLFYTSRLSFDGQFDAIGLDFDEVFFVEVSNGLLEDFLADSKHGVNLIGGRFVVVGRKSVGRKFEVLEETGGKIANEDTTVGRCISVLIVHGLSCNGFLELFNLAGANDTIGFVVDVAIDLIALSSLHTHFLFAERAEKVFHEAPVEIGSIFICPCAFQVGELSYFDEWLLGGGNETFLLVEIKEHVKDVANLGALWHITLRQQNVANLAAFKIDSMVFLTQDFQLIPLAQ